MKTHTGKRRDSVKEQFWLRTIADQACSGLSVRAFCEREGLEPWNFHWWRQALSRRDWEVPPASTVSETVRRFEPKVTVRGEEYVIVDIGLRMSSPPELYRAQGFPEGHLIAPEIGGKRLSKTAQVRMCSNSVCPPIAAAVARAQFDGSPQRIAA